MKAQVLLLPNGMIGSIFITTLRHNDNGVQNLSNLNGYLRGILDPLYRDSNNNQVYPAVYGDAIFTPLATIIRPYTSPNEEQKIVNTRFSSLREDIEHKFSQVFGRYKILSSPEKHKLFNNGEYVKKTFFSCLFVSNCWTCLCESRNETHGMRAPTLQEYLPLDEALVPAPELEGNPNHPNYQ